MKKYILCRIIIIILFSNQALAQNSSNRGFVNITKFSLHSVHRFDESVGIGNSEQSIRENNSMAFGFETINGWFIFPWLSAGVGIGYDYYNVPKHHTFPAYIDLRAYFSRFGNCFYMNFNIGTLIPLDNRYSKGQVVNLGIGYKFDISPTLSMQIGLVANSKMFDISGYPKPEPIHEFTANSVSFDIAIMF
ncbi:MAG: hypothetical protein L3J74_01765 [Bacteroidales bacterium]|nr:hypothetical protein [Bacteroidales bacterium]